MLENDLDFKKKKNWVSDVNLRYKPNDQRCPFHISQILSNMM